MSYSNIYTATLDINQTPGFTTVKFKVHWHDRNCVSIMGTNLMRMEIYWNQIEAVNVWQRHSFLYLRDQGVHSYTCTRGYGIPISRCYSSLVFGRSVLPSSWPETHSYACILGYVWPWVEECVLLVRVLGRRFGSIWSVDCPSACLSNIGYVQVCTNWMMDHHHAFNAGQEKLPFHKESVCRQRGAKKEPGRGSKVPFVWSHSSNEYVFNLWHSVLLFPNSSWRTIFTLSTLHWVQSADYAADLSILTQSSDLRFVEGSYGLSRSILYAYIYIYIYLYSIVCVYCILHL